MNKDKQITFAFSIPFVLFPSIDIIVYTMWISGAVALQVLVICIIHLFVHSAYYNSPNTLGVLCQGARIPWNGGNDEFNNTS